MKRMFAAVLLLLLSGSLFGQGTQWYPGTFDEALTEAQGKNKLVLIFFFSKN